LGRITKDKTERNNIREEFYKKVDNGTVVPREAVRVLRKIMGLTQPQFAKKMGVSLFALRAIEQGNGNPTVETLEKLIEIGDLALVVGRASKL
jgi:DNA-binding XRE family transcriptional regulator